MARPGEVERDRAAEVLERTVAERTAQLDRIRSLACDTDIPQMCGNDAGWACGRACP